MNAIIEKLHAAERFVNEVLGDVRCRVEVSEFTGVEVLLTDFRDYQRLFAGREVRKRVLASNSTHYEFTDHDYGVIVRSVDLTEHMGSDSTVTL